MGDEKHTILIVDDTEENIDILVAALEEYDLRVALDGESALEDIEREHPDLILLDIMMPGIDGYEVCRRLKADDDLHNIPILFITSLAESENEKQGLLLGAVDYITKPFNPVLVRARVKNQLELKTHRDNLEKLVRERTKELEVTRDVTIEGMAALAEYRDPETGGHIVRTKNYVKTLALELRNQPKYEQLLSDKMVDALYKSAPLHDIGKVGVPDHILMKPGRLTAEEFEEMKRHTVYGRDALMLSKQKLGENSFLSVAIEIAESHQEKWDGSGYPNGWRAEEIPLSGRIMAVADVYDALISKRVYKDPLPHETAVRIIEEGSGSHFDPDVVLAFVAVQETFREIAIENCDYEEERKALGG